MKKYMKSLFEEKKINQENFHEFIKSLFNILDSFKKVQMNVNSYKILLNTLKFAKVAKTI